MPCTGCARWPSSADDDADQPFAAALGRSGKVEAGGPDVAGLQAVHSLEAAEQAVVVAVGATFEGEGAQAEIVEALGEIALQPERQRRHIPGGGDLLGVGKAVRVAERGSGHPDRPGGAGHPLGEGPLASRQPLRHHHGDIVRRLGDQRLDAVLDEDRLAGLEPELGGRARRRVGGHLESRVELHAARLQILEQEIKRHHLGQRGGIAGGIGIPGEQHLTAPGIDRDGGEPGGRCRIAKADQRHQESHCDLGGAATAQARCALRRGPFKHCRPPAVRPSREGRRNSDAAGEPELRRPHRVWAFAMR
jgi:hypothetical protein